MAKYYKHNHQSHYLTLNKQEAVSIIAFLSAQLGKTNLPGHVVGECPSSLTMRLFYYRCDCLSGLKDLLSMILMRTSFSFLSRIELINQL